MNTLQLYTTATVQQNTRTDRKTR